MLEINDTGKVWMRGKIKPDFAVRVGEIIIVPGKDEDDEINYWVEGEFFCVDLQDKKKHKRVARTFPLKAEGTAPGSLFSGFKKTKHADILAVTPDGAGVVEYVVEGEEYINSSIQSLSSHEFCKKNGFPEV